jgi:hypothetical protein
MSTRSRSKSVRRSPSKKRSKSKSTYRHITKRSRSRSKSKPTSKSKSKSKARSRSKSKSISRTSNKRSKSRAKSAKRSRSFSPKLPEISPIDTPDRDPDAPIGSPTSPISPELNNYPTPILSSITPNSQLQLPYSQSYSSTSNYPSPYPYYTGTGGTDMIYKEWGVISYLRQQRMVEANRTSMIRIQIEKEIKELKSQLQNLKETLQTRELYYENLNQIQKRPDLPPPPPRSSFSSSGLSSSSNSSSCLLTLEQQKSQSRALRALTAQLQCGFCGRFHVVPLFSKCGHTACPQCYFNQIQKRLQKFINTTEDYNSQLLNHFGIYKKSIHNSMQQQQQQQQFVYPFILCPQCSKTKKSIFEITPFLDPILSEILTSAISYVYYSSLSGSAQLKNLQQHKKIKICVCQRKHWCSNDTQTPKMYPFAVAYSETANCVLAQIQHETNLQISRINQSVRCCHCRTSWTNGTSLVKHWNSPSSCLTK